jgi:hypothetical protein
MLNWPLRLLRLLSCAALNALARYLLHVPMWHGQSTEAREVKCTCYNLLSPRRDSQDYIRTMSCSSSGSSPRPVLMLALGLGADSKRGCRTAYVCGRPGVAIGRPSAAPKDSVDSCAPHPASVPTPTCPPAHLLRPRQLGYGAMHTTYHTQESIKPAHLETPKPLTTRNSLAHLPTCPLAHLTAAQLLVEPCAGTRSRSAINPDHKTRTGPRNVTRRQREGRVDRIVRRGGQRGCD